MITLLLWILLGPLAVLWVLTRLGTVYLERAHPALGEKVFSDASDAPLHLVAWGTPSKDRPSLVFVHGASSNHREFIIALGDQIKQRLGPDQHCVFVDRPGQGGSPAWPGDYSPRVQADRIMGAARVCGADQCVVVGHSWGGSVVAQMGVHHSQSVCGIAFVAPATHPWPGGVDWFYGFADKPVLGWLFTRLVTLPVGWFQVSPGVENAFAPEPVKRSYASDLAARLVLRPKAFRANARDVYRLKSFVVQEASTYTQIACPVHIITGDEDQVVWPHIHSDGLEQDIPGAQKSVITGAGHMPHHTHPGLVMDALQDLIARGCTPDARCETSAQSVSA